MLSCSQRRLNWARSRVRLRKSTSPTHQSQHSILFVPARPRKFSRPIIWTRLQEVPRLKYWIRLCRQTENDQRTSLREKKKHIQRLPIASCQQAPLPAPSLSSVLTRTIPTSQEQLGQGIFKMTSLKPKEVTFCLLSKAGIRLPDLRTFRPVEMSRLQSLAIVRGITRMTCLDHPEIWWRCVKG